MQTDKLPLVSAEERRRSSCFLHFLHFLHPRLDQPTNNAPKMYYYIRSLSTKKHPAACFADYGPVVIYILPGPLAWGFSPYFRPACTRVKRRCSTTGQIHQRRHKLLSCNRTLGLLHTHVEALGPSRLHVGVREPSLPRHQVLTSLRVRHAQWKTVQCNTPTLALSSNLEYWGSRSAAQSCCASVDGLFSVTNRTIAFQVVQSVEPLQNMHNLQHRVFDLHDVAQWHSSKPLWAFVYLPVTSSLRFKRHILAGQPLLFV
jgi:hypothetical protein